MQDEAVKQTKKNVAVTNLILVLLVVALTVLPLFVVRDAEFGGADGEAEELIAEINPGYEPWFSPVFEPPSGEIESLLFVLQAAIGAGVIGFGLGYLKGARRKVDGKAV
ncbi:MAG: Cobalt ECF transporter, additional substrate-binding protein CbiN [Firmicutes bacterium]|nr:Cobalt ECF transporter, additional substrate-binding protein CbiN [Bacillota bacterium]MDI6707194.1 energy-coupling factor ABC transporter substrate-binding protein [Bacillota bacterium]